MHWQIITPNTSVPRDIDPSKCILCCLLQITSKDRHSMHIYSLQRYFSTLSASVNLGTQGSTASVFLTSPIFHQLLERYRKCHHNTERRKSFPDGLSHCWWLLLCYFHSEHSALHTGKHFESWTYCILWVMEQGQSAEGTAFSKLENTASPFVLWALPSLFSVCMMLLCLPFLSSGVFEGEKKMMQS